MVGAPSLLRLIAVLGALLGAVLLIGGLWLAFGGASADTRFNLFGNAFSSTNVGVSMAGIGAVLVLVTFRGVLRSADRLAARPDAAAPTHPAWPADKSIEALKRKLDRISQTNAKILKAISAAGQYGVYPDELSKAVGITRDELVYRGKELQNDGLIEVLPLTDLNFRLHEDVVNLLGANAAQFFATR